MVFVEGMLKDTIEAASEKPILMARCASEALWARFIEAVETGAALP